MVNFDHQNEKLHDQEMIHIVIELFLGLYEIWHCLIEITCRPHLHFAI